jgi:transcriptional regulator with GAF, ATPase, and Fis domain
VKAPIFEVTPGSTHDSNALERERARADDNARLAALLTQVVRSSSALMGAPDFEAGLHQWLSQCSSATRAQRASLYDLATHEPTGLRTLRALTEWTHDDATGNVMHRLAAPFVLDPTGAEEAMAAITSGKVYAVHTEDTRSPMREFLQAQGNATVIAVPIFRGGVQWGALSFDHAQRRELNAADVSVLETAAETLAGILDRRDSMQALLAERAPMTTPAWPACWKKWCEVHARCWMRRISNQRCSSGWVTSAAQPMPFAPRFTTWPFMSRQG